MYKFQKIYPIANRMLMLLTKDDSGMFFSCTCNIHIVCIVGAEYTVHRYRSFQMVNVLVA